MITITRSQARRLRAVFRRHVLGISHRGTIPPLVLRAENTQLRAQYRYSALAIEHFEEGHSSRETIALPLDALADIEGAMSLRLSWRRFRPKPRRRWGHHGIQTASTPWWPPKPGCVSRPRRGSTRQASY